MSFESYNRIMTGLNKCIRSGKSISFSFDGSGNENASRLFITGETNISPYWKTEPDYQMLYRRIDDSLRSDVAENDRFCLDFSGKACKYPKIAFKKLVTPFSTPMFVLNDCTDNWTFGIRAKAQDLEINGYLRICVEVRYKNEEYVRHSTAMPPHLVYTVDIPEGNYDWTEFNKDIKIDLEKIANVCYYVEGENYEGEIYFESPNFTSESGHNLLGQFLPHTEDRAGINWMGQNLSRIEWIGLKVDINGKAVFDGEVFERCHRFSDAEIALEKNIIRDGENVITFSCTSNYRDAAGYVLREWGFITDKNSRIISVPEIITAGKPFHICVEGNAGDIFTFSSCLVRALGDLTLTADGLAALDFICDVAANEIKMTLDGEEITISRCVEKEDDKVITGTGDMIYVPVDSFHVTNYLKWYLSNHIGNLLTIRPTYRWNGTRIPEEGLYRKTADLLNSMGISYSHMLDGRELPGCNSNPAIEEIESESFLGRQTHEFDGQFVYWGRTNVTNKLSDQMFYDLFLRMYRSYSETMNKQYIPENIRYNDDTQCIFRSPDMPRDMQKAAEDFIESLRVTRKGNLRHTGPSTLFKYLYQAGYTWLGAELMYTPTELTIASLRGANRVYGGKMGAHHAVQWSSSPHDTEYRYRRYRLALFISYIQGIDEINTEEGLWRLEEYYNFHHRFTPACENHTKVQKDFFRYISTHTRRGRFYTPIAFLSGRYDGWRCFGRENNTWGVDNFGFTDIERAWDVLTFFYPKSVLDSLYRHNCPNEEIGYYSGTPHGNVDIIPIEADDFSSYRLLIAPGFNKAMNEDIEKLKNYVTRGGILLLGWPQLSVTTDRESAVNCEHTYFDEKKRNFLSDTYCGHPVSICEDTEYDSVLVYTDSNKPLVTLKKAGKGTVCFVNAKEYAGSEAVDLAYRKAMEILTKSCLSEEKIYASGNRNVQFTVFEKENGSRDIYFIATDWHKEEPDGIGKLILGDREYSIPVAWGQTVKVTAYECAAIYPENDENEVLSFDGNVARVQGVGISNFILCKNGNEKIITVDFRDSSIKELDLL